MKNVFSCSYINCYGPPRIDEYTLQEVYQRSEKAAREEVEAHRRRVENKIINDIRKEAN